MDTLKSGVYMIVNCINNKKYIGSSKNVSQRIRQHKNQLKYNIHGNKHLQSSYNKYGSNMFVFSLIEYCINYIEKENFYVEQFNTLNPKYGYNKASNIKSTSGYKWSPESRHRLSEAKKGKKMHPNTLRALVEANKNRIYQTGRNFHKNNIPFACKCNEKPVLQYDLSGKFIKEYHSIKATQQDGFHANSVALCCRNNRNHSGGYIWRFKTSSNIPQNIEIQFTKQAKIKHFERIHSNMNNEFGELLGNPEVDNQQPSVEKDTKVSTKVQRLTSEESTNNLDTSAESPIEINPEDLIIYHDEMISGGLKSIGE